MAEAQHGRTVGARRIPVQGLGGALGKDEIVPKRVPVQHDDVEACTHAPRESSSRTPQPDDRSLWIPSDTPVSRAGGSSWNTPSVEDESKVSGQVVGSDPQPGSHRDVPPAPTKKQMKDGRILHIVRANGEIERRTVAPIPFSFDRPPPTHTPSIHSDSSEFDTTSPLWGRSMLHQRRSRPSEYSSPESPLTAEDQEMVEERVSGWLSDTWTDSPEEFPFDAARLTRKVFGNQRKHSQEGSDPALPSAPMDALHNTTNVLRCPGYLGHSSSAADTMANNLASQHVKPHNGLHRASLPELTLPLSTLAISRSRDAQSPQATNVISKTVPSSPSLPPTRPFGPLRPAAILRPHPPRPSRIPRPIRRPLPLRPLAPNLSIPHPTSSVSTSATTLPAVRAAHQALALAILEGRRQP